jgi:hypothetical protein
MFWKWKKQPPQDDVPFVRVQTRKRLWLDKRNIGKEIHIGFADGARYYIYPHDEIMDEILATRNVGKTKSWIERGLYHWPSLPKWAVELLAQYEVTERRQQHEPIVKGEAKTQWPNDDVQFVRVQKRTNLFISKKNIGKAYHIAFAFDGRYYLYPHDEVMNEIVSKKNVGNTKSWIERGLFHWPYPPKWAREMLAQYEVTKRMYDRAVVHHSFS